MADLIDRDKLLCAYCTDCNSGEKKPCPIPGRCHEFNLIKNAPAVNRWIPVEDALPETTGYYLVWTDSEIVDIAEFYTFADFVPKEIANNYWNKASTVLYWMPLPEPPKSEVHGDAYTRAQDDDYAEF